MPKPKPISKKLAEAKSAYQDEFDLNMRDMYGANIDHDRAVSVAHMAAMNAFFNNYYGDEYGD